MNGNMKVLSALPHKQNNSSGQLKHLFSLFRSVFAPSPFPGMPLPISSIFVVHMEMGRFCIKARKILWNCPALLHFSDTPLLRNGPLLIKTLNPSTPCLWPEKSSVAHLLKKEEELKWWNDEIRDHQGSIQHHSAEIQPIAQKGFSTCSKTSFHWS